MEKEKNTQPHVTKNYHFEHVGQYIDYIHTQYVTIDKDAGIQIAEVNNQQPAPPTEPTQQPSYTRHIDTTASITTIGKLLVADANSAKTKAEFINKISEIVQRTQLFTFKPDTSNQQKADFINAILAAYGYKGTKCANITDDDFQRYF